MIAKSFSNKPDIKWTLKDLGLFLGIEFLLLTGLLITANWLFGEQGYLKTLDEATTTGILYFLQTLMLLGPLYFFTKFKYGSDSKTFGLKKINPKIIIKRVVQGFLFYYLVSALFTQIVLSYKVEIPGFGDQASHIPLFGDALYGLLIGGVIIVFFAPAVEEFFFRGYLYQILCKYSGPLWGSILSAAFFALFHFEFNVFIPIFILGLVLNWLFKKSGSLWTPIIFHITNNALAFFIELALYFHWISL